MIYNLPQISDQPGPYNLTPMKDFANSAPASKAQMRSRLTNCDACKRLETNCILLATLNKACVQSFSQFGWEEHPEPCKVNTEQTLTKRDFCGFW